MNKVTEIESFTKAKCDLIKLKAELEKKLIEVNKALELSDCETKTESIATTETKTIPAPYKPTIKQGKPEVFENISGLTAFIKHLLAMEGPMTRKDIIGAVVASGVKTGKNVSASVSQVIYNKKHVKRLKDGLFSV